MSRRARVVVPGIAHHITQRGNNRRDVFLSDQDRHEYVGLLHYYARRHDCRILGWCLMTNHIHLIAIPEEERALALTLGEAHAQYSLRLNKQENWVGHIWQNRFYSSPLASTHLLIAMRYVDLNPVRAGLVGTAAEWSWSSARGHSCPSASDPLLYAGWKEWIQEARLGEWDYENWGIGLDCGNKSLEEAKQIRRATRVGEPLGSEEFITGLELETGRRLRVLKRGRPKTKKALVVAGMK